MQQEHVLRPFGERTSPSVDIVLFGLGPIGQAVGRAAIQRSDVRILGGVDINPALVGRSLNSVLGIAHAPDLPSVVSKADQLPQGHEHAVAIQTTSSQLDKVAPQMLDLLRAGYHVVSSTEEATSPYLRHPALAEQMHQAALDANRCIIGAGINPGFVMDLLPVLLSAPCLSVRTVSVERIVNASLRREPLQRKIGSGMSPEAFEALARQDKIGHVGLVESAAFLASHLGMNVYRVIERLEPVVARSRIQTEYVSVESGQVRGILHQAWGYGDDRECIRLKLVMALDEPESYDHVSLEADPPVEVRVQGGYHGDVATAAMLLNLLVPVTRGAPGFHSVRDLGGLGLQVEHTTYSLG